MVILKNLETGEIYNFIMVFIGTYDYLMHTTSFENNSYLHREADFDGKLVETGDVEDIFHNPCHEYTKGLLRSIPKAHEKGGELQAIPGTPPDLMEPPVGCPFAARCKETMIVCQKYMPDYTDCGKNHKSACWMLDEMAQEVNSDEK